MINLCCPKQLVFQLVDIVVESSSDTRCPSIAPFEVQSDAFVRGPIPSVVYFIVRSWPTLAVKLSTEVAVSELLGFSGTSTDEDGEVAIPVPPIDPAPTPAVLGPGVTVVHDVVRKRARFLLGVLEASHNFKLKFTTLHRVDIVDGLRTHAV